MPYSISRPLSEQVLRALGLLQHELEAAVKSDIPLNEIVTLLRQYKEQGITQDQVYSFLEAMHHAAPDEVTDDRILEVADFVAGFCSPHMKVWDGHKH